MLCVYDRVCVCVHSSVQYIDRKEVAAVQRSSITAACSHIEGSGPHHVLARYRGAQLLGLAGAASTGCTKPAVQTTRRMHSHRNHNGGKGNGVVTDRSVEFQVDKHAPQRTHAHTSTR